MFKYFLTVLMLSFFNVATAKAITKCVVSMEDIGTGTVYKIERKKSSEDKQSIAELLTGAESIVIDFNLPSKLYGECSFKYLDQDSGTSLSCWFDKLGHHYVQSDRTSDDDSPRKNSLTVRYKELHFDINAICK
jgi:hypothetical protein